MNQFFLFISCKIHLFLTTTSHQYYIPTRNFHNLSDVSNKGRLFLTRPIYLPIRYGRWLGPYDVYLTRPFLHSSGAYRNCHSARRRVFMHDNLAQRCFLMPPLFKSPPTTGRRTMFCISKLGSVG